MYKFSFDLWVLSSIAANASKTCLDTFNAKSAVNTKYIIPIIFCLGVSLPPAIISNFLFNKLKFLLGYN